MPTPRTLLLPALFAALTAGTASASQVYFENVCGLSAMVDVYVDGQLVLDDVLTLSFTPFPAGMAGGPHRVVVTPSRLAAGQRDLVNQTVTLGANGTYTLKLAHDEDHFDTAVLSVEAGMGDPD